MKLLKIYCIEYKYINYNNNNNNNNNNNLLLGSFHHRRGFQKGPIKTKYEIYKQVEIYN